MASVISHTAVPLAMALGLGARRVPPRLLLLACIASAAPDLDVIGFRAGIAYGSVLGHRGISHSLFFALFSAILVSPFSRILGSTRLITASVVFAATASHGLLDALTSGGLGVAFFAPLSVDRYFLPWRVIRVSPIGIAPFFSEWGLRVIRSELQWVWAPSVAAGLLGLLIRKLLIRRQTGRAGGHTSDAAPDAPSS
ncbi:MAG TPA: metal-dependent hydrolase [Steroidobacter sp.]|nr:metal-dependent hydrolase [Steroidobacter sp.]